MGVDTLCWLPANVRLDRVCRVVCRLLGSNQPVQRYCSPDHPITRVLIHCPVGTFSSQGRFSFDYHWESSGPRDGWGGCRCLRMRSRALPLAVFTRLVDFFGGEVCLDDCDEEWKHYGVACKSDALNCAQDGDDWKLLEERTEAVQALSEEEIQPYLALAAYKDSSSLY